MLVDDGIRALIAKQAAVTEIKKAVVQAAMWTLGQDGLEKVMLGLTSPEEVMDVVFVA